jgi:non-ribosomal peptide synthetase-like protein
MLTCRDHDNTIRWTPGERLDDLFEQRCDELADHLAVETENETLTFRQLDERANQLARHLRAQGIQAGARIGLMFDKTPDSYVALLGVLKAHAAYVPFDASFPTDRIEFIMADAEVKTVLSMSTFQEKLSEFSVPVICLDSAAAEIGAQSGERLSAEEKGDDSDPLAYLIYTSGTTGKPKGVIIDHGSICNFVRVAAEVYGYAAGDRVYQGMTIAFDFSVEELWVPLLAGATLIPAKPGVTLVGDDLADYLASRKVTGLACVPTLLATIERELPDLRLLLVSGEACPQDLVERWHSPTRTILNAYGPTEATVTATLTELIPDKAVTIGGPLPTYTIVVLEEDAAKQVPEGGMGEICIAGIGLARGYLNREDLTAEKFIPDFLDIENNPSRRIYRTGDLGCINDAGEVEFHGRIDTQVKIRGYRIELGEIEALLLESPDIVQAVVDTWEPEPGAVELVAYYTLAQDVENFDVPATAARLKERLPSYMVPAYFEQLEMIPMTPSHKADRKNLPAPTGARVSVGSGEYTAPRDEAEQMLADALAAVLNVERVSVEDDFFKDLGAHSLLMARFCSDVRKSQGADLAMRDIYLNPTVAKLAEHLANAPQEASVPLSRAAEFPPHEPSDWAYYRTGALQAATYALMGAVAAWVLLQAFHWTWPVRDDLGELYRRVLIYSVGMMALWIALPVVVKWLLIGRWEEEHFPVWSMRYFRFWFAKMLVQTSPMAAFKGYPIFNVYLRMLGARIGKNVVLHTGVIPVCTDLISIGDNVILRRDSVMLGYKAHSNYILTGGVQIGDDCFVGEASVVDIGTEMGNGCQLGHASSLHEGQSVPDGVRVHGSPARETSADYCQVEPRPCGGLRKFAYSVYQVLPALLVYAPLGVIVMYVGFPLVIGSANIGGLSLGGVTLDLTPESVFGSLALFLGGLVLGLVSVTVVPRLANLLLTEGRTYPLYGIHYVAYGIVSGASNSKFYNLIFGDSSAIVHYLPWLGINLNEIEQTGSNFGTNQRHESPFLCSIGSGTMVSDGLSMMNAEISSTSFRLSQVSIGDKNYLGNNIHYPPDGKTGVNVLLGTKVMIPIEGPMRENVGLLGSPPFEIPRAVDRDRDFDSDLEDERRREQLSQKNRHNFATVATYLLCLWGLSFLAILTTCLVVLYYQRYGVWAVAAVFSILPFVVIGYLSLMERAGAGFRRLQPKVVSIYHPDFWFHERHWKYAETALMSLFSGTPFKNVISRLAGIRVGHKVFDDGAQFIDKTMLSVGAGSNLNHGVTLQGHSLEEGVFKLDSIEIGERCTLGVGAFVHYGVRMGDRVVLAADSFLMKGEMPDAQTTWSGNPARVVSAPADAASAETAAA